MEDGRGMNGKSDRCGAFARTTAKERRTTDEDEDEDEQEDEDDQEDEKEEDEAKRGRFAYPAGECDFRKTKNCMRTNVTKVAGGTAKSFAIKMFCVIVERQR
jgi:hypothetical protein